MIAEAISTNAFLPIAFDFADTRSLPFSTFMKINLLLFFKYSAEHIFTAEDITHHFSDIRKCVYANAKNF